MKKSALTPYTRGALALILLPGFAFGLLRHSPHSAPPPAPISCPVKVALDLGMVWTLEEGVTENLDQFHADLIYCEMQRGQWICWDEENSAMPNGLERICGTPTQLNDTLAAGVRIWWTDLSSPIRNGEGQEDMPCWDCNRMGNRMCGKGSDIPSAFPFLPSALSPLAL